MKKTLRFARNSLVAFGLLFIFVTVTPLVPWWTRRLAGPWDDPRGDILIVLGGSMLEDGTLGTSSYWRALYGVRVWRQDHFREIFISGGTEANPVAGHMRDFMVFLGVPASIVRIEAESRSTRENALFAQKLLAESPGRKVLLTSDYHM